MSANDTTKQLSIVDIRNYMLQNDGKVTNHALVKHFKKYLTHTQSESESIPCEMRICVHIKLPVDIISQVLTKRN